MPRTTPRLSYPLLVVLVLLLLPLLLGCSSDASSAATETDAGPVAVGTVALTINGTTTPITVQDKRTFTANVTGTSDTTVKWSVAAPGGGVISATGEYTASATPGTYAIVATSPLPT